MHPYEISTTLRSRGKEMSIKLNYGSLYSVVESMLKRGLIPRWRRRREGRRPERTVYEITDAGRIEHEDWLAQLLSIPVREFTSLEAGLSMMAGLAPDEVAQLLGDRAERLRMELRALDATLSVASEAAVADLFLVEGRYRRAMLSAEMDFVTDWPKASARDVRRRQAWAAHSRIAGDGVTFEQVSADPVGYLGEEGRSSCRHLADR